MNKRGKAPLGIGLVSMFTVLLVLVLAVFSALTLSAARADLALSRTNAETIAAYYAADAQAVRLCQALRSGGVLDEQIPVTEKQSLHIRALHGQAGLEILSWQTVPAEAGMDLEDEGIPVWDGTLPG